MADDFLHVLWLQQQLLTGKQDCKFCHKARILSLGSYPKVFNHQEDSNKVREDKSFSKEKKKGKSIMNHFCFSFSVADGSASVDQQQAQYGHGFQPFSVD